MRPAILLFVLLAFCQISYATIINVPADQPTIQAGINAANAGDTILIADGTYVGTGNRDISFFGKDVLVTSANGPEFTIIDCQATLRSRHRAFILNNNEGPNAVINGITIKNGLAPFLDNHGQYSGGAIVTDHASPKISNCVFISNHSEYQGGAIASFYDSASVLGCTFVFNGAQYGASMFFASAVPVVENCNVVYGTQGFPFYGNPIVNCCNVFGNAEGDWIGGMADQLGSNGNSSADPLFCDTAALDLHIAENSICAPANNDCNQLIGAMPVGCGPINRTIVVYPDGSGDAANIQMAVDMAYNGDTVLLMPGTFSGPGNRDVFREDIAVHIIGAGSDSTVIDCQGYSGLDIREYYEDLSGSFSGFTVKNAATGLQFDGGGKAIDLILKNCNIGMVYSGGPGEPIIDSCSFLDCSQIGLHAFSGFTKIIRNCVFGGNLNAGATVSDGEFVNCLFLNNLSAYSGENPQPVHLSSCQ